METNIPIRPTDDKSKISKGDKDAIVVQVLTGWSNERVFLLFHPEYATADWKSLNNEGKRACRQFFQYNGNKYFKEAYEAELAKFLGRGKRNRETTPEAGDAIDNSRKERALRNLATQAMNLVDDMSLDADTLKVVTDIFNKLGYIRSEEEHTEPPRRYLPIRCGECDYRALAESLMARGDIENTCLRCKALDVAKEYGFRYDPKTLLNNNMQDECVNLGN